MVKQTSQWKKRLGAVLLVLFVVLGGVAYVAWDNLFREVPVTYESPEEHFKYGSIGTENAEGLPYAIWLVLPRLFPEYLPGPGGYTSLGFVWEPGQETPVGISKKTIGFPRQGITCAVCHHTTLRDTPESISSLYLAGPPVKFDSQQYLRFLFACANDPRFNANHILDEIQQNQPLSWLDKLLYRFVLIPQTKQGILQQQQSYAWMETRPDWGPGRIDPFNPVKFRLLDQPLDDTIGNSDMMPLWNEKQHEGFAYHWDGLVTSLVEGVRTGAIGDGATKKSIPIAGLDRVTEFIQELPPPKYPYDIQPKLASQGSQIFANTCASCHAFGGDRTGTIIPVDEVGTDRHRLDMWTAEAAKAYNQFAEGYDWDFNTLQKTNGYVAVALDGIWLRAPYLHNGSVPTLRDLLEAPENRPKKFYRGNDVYAPEEVGFVSDVATEKGQEYFQYDTEVPANGNQGHLYGLDLSDQEKTALVEYLKTL